MTTLELTAQNINSLKLGSVNLVSVAGYMSTKSLRLTADNIISFDRSVSEDHYDRRHENFYDYKDFLKGLKTDVVNVSIQEHGRFETFYYDPQKKVSYINLIFYLDAIGYYSGAK